MTKSDISTMPDRSTVLAAMRLASRAPSVHNTQPWRWILDGTSLRLYRDDQRLLDVADPSGRQLVISCGAMLHHVRTAFAAAGWHTDTARLPDSSRPELLASVTFRRWPDPPAAVVARADAIARRHTDRLPMREPQDWDVLAHELGLLVAPYEVAMDVLDESARPRLATASEHSAAVQRYDMQYQAELHWWTGHSAPSDGVPREALASPREVGNTPIGRSFPSVPRPPRRDDVDRSRLVVLSTHGDSVSEWLAVGEALSAALLECTAAGAASCALTHLTELPAARRLLAGLIGRPVTPQVVVRVGAEDAGPGAAITPRRPVTEILTISATPE